MAWAAGLAHTSVDRLVDRLQESLPRRVVELVGIDYMTFYLKHNT